MAKQAFGRKEIGQLVRKIMRTYADDRGINHLEGLPIPDRNAILSAVDDLRFILFPGFNDSRPVSHTNIEYLVGDLLDSIYSVLAKEIETAFHYQCTLSKVVNCNCSAVAAAAAMKLLNAIPRIREVLKTDVAAAFNCDPAAKSFDEIILAYPGIQAISMHRIAHELYLAEVPLIPRIISEYAHSLTGIDIHPGAEIGKYFFIDHGTGIVIGETTEIGNNVKIYMGVTLGALAPTRGQLLRNSKRHPTIEDDVTIYAGATILGGKSVIGRGSVINGNVFLTRGIPPYTIVGMSPPELHFRGNKPAKQARPPRKLKWVCPAGKNICKSKTCKPSKTRAAGKKAKKKASRG